MAQPQLADYGPIQMGEAVGLSRGEVDRAIAAGLIPRADRGGRWSAETVATLDAAAIRAELGPHPLGAGRCAERLAEATGLAVTSTDIETLAERGLAHVVDWFKKWPLYDVKELDAIPGDPAGLTLLTELVDEREAWTAASLDLWAAAERLGWRRDEFTTAAAAAGVVPGLFGRYALADLDRMASDAELAEKLRQDRLLGPDQAAAHLEIRRRDFEYVLAAGWLTPAKVIHSRVGRRKTVPVPLYRTGDIETVLDIPGVDWDAVRTVAPGEPSPLREHARLAASRAQVIRAFCAQLGAQHSVEVWPHWVNATDTWEIDWERRADGHPTKDEVTHAIGEHPAAASYRREIVLDTPAGEVIRWARAMLEPGAAVVLDTETTDLDGVVIEIAVLDAATGEVLLDTLVDPAGTPINPAARAVHGITDVELAEAPAWAAVYPQLLQVIGDRHVLAYNAAFDCDVITRTTAAAGLDAAPLEQLRTGDRWGCLMNARSDWARLWRWLPLGGGHRARGDALDALRVLRMLGAPS
jgi:hypothetical protein